MKVGELSKLTETEVIERVRASALEILTLRMGKQLGQLKSPARLQTLRRDVARMKMVLLKRVREGKQETVAVKPEEK
ncbi:MAG: 50S ribosomal protein L29 [Puniceicoccales bacterium]|jgi:ribosomal protein L29|nr:50S ribosomal protein L29 [Puniceicoccales bacterium]